MSELLVIQNISREAPGLLGKVLHRQKVAFDLVDLSRGQQLPSLVGYRALVVLGGPASANDTTETMTGELAYVKQALDSGLPFLGICLGMQVLVKVAGGQIVPGKRTEAGFRDPDGQPYRIELTVTGQQDPLLAGLPALLPVFQLHGEVAELNHDMQLLGTAPVSPNQIVKVGARAYGIQSHFELTGDMLRVWAAEDPDLRPIGYAQLQQDFAAVKEEYTKTGETLLMNFLRLAGLTD